MSAEPRPLSHIKFILQGLCVVVASLPIITFLAHVGLIRTTSEIPTRQLSAEAGLLRVKRPFTQQHGPVDHPRFSVLYEGKELPRKPFAQDLAQSSGPAFWGKDFVLYLKPPPAQSTPSATKGTYAVRRPLRTPYWAWLAWGAISSGALLLAWQRGWLRNIRHEMSALWRTVDGALISVQHNVAWHTSLAVLSVIAIAATYWDKVSSPYLVAEDGPVFLTESLGHGTMAMVMPYAGYLHTLPRIAAALAIQFPLEQFPTVAVYTCLIVMGIIIYCITQWLLDWKEQLAAVGFICLAPFGGYLMLSMTNLQWFSGIALAVLATHPAPTPTTFRGKTALLAAAAIMALTGPFAIVTLPIFVGMAMLFRTPFRVALAATQVGPAMLQIAIVLIHPSPDQQAPTDLRSSVAPWLGDFVQGFFGSPSWLMEAPHPWKFLPGLLLGGILLGGLCSSLRRERFPSRLLILLSLATLFASAGWLRSNGLSRPWGGGDRYYVVPYALLVIAMASLLRNTRLPRGLRVTALAVLMTCMLGYRDSTVPTLTVPNWADQVARVQAGGAAFIKTWPPSGDWSVLLARDPNGHWLRGEAYQQVTLPR